MNRTLLALAFFVALSAPAMAGQCQDDIAKIDAALAADSNLTPEQKQQVDDLRNQAVQLCGAGNDAEGLDQAAQAMVILNIQ